MRHERHNLHGDGAAPCEVYDMPPAADYWDAVTDVPCPVEGCGQHVVWYEAGYVPGYRVCMAAAEEPGMYIAETLRHRFLAGGTAELPTLIRDRRCETADTTQD